MDRWKIPGKAKVYEALSAVADGRVKLLTANRAEVRSSSRERTYSIEWDEQRMKFRSTDNASRWQGTLGYPVVAVMIEIGRIDVDRSAIASLAGIPWKHLNDKARRNYDEVVEQVLSGLAEKGVDIRSMQKEVDRIHARLQELAPAKFTARDGRR